MFLPPQPISKMSPACRELLAALAHFRLPPFFVASLFFFALGIPSNAHTQSIQWEECDGQWVGDVRALCQTSDGSLLVGAEGINKTTDGGATWAKGRGAIGSNAVISLQSVDDHLIFAGTYAGGIFLSTDVGNTWAARNQGLGNLTVHTLSFLPPITLLAATDGGLFFSRDSGASWHADRVIGAQTVTAAAATKGGLIFVATVQSGIYWSSDAGAHWLNIGPNVTGTSIGALVTVSDSLLVVNSYDPGINAWVLNVIAHADQWRRRSSYIVEGWAAQPPPVAGFSLCADGTLLAARSGGVWKSTDSGATWFPPSHEASLFSFFCILQRPDGSCVAGSSNTVMVSMDTARSWQQITHGLPGWMEFSSERLATDSGLRVYVSSIGGIYRTTDNGTRWDLFRINGEDPPVSVLAASPGGALFAATKTSGIYRSLDHAETWKQVMTGVLDSNILSLAFSRSGVIYAGSTNGGIFQSTNGGDTWVLANQMRPSTEVISLLVPTSGSVLALNSFGKMLRSTDGGVTWPFVEPDPFSANGYWWLDAMSEGLQGHIYASFGGSIFRSTDDGLTWDPFQVGLAPALCSFVIDPAGELYSTGALEGGTLYRMREKDERWFDLGVTAPPVLAVDSTGYLWSTGYGPHVLRSIGLSTPVRDAELAQLPAELKLEQNFPNPFNPSTNIRFFLPTAGHVELTIVDILGRQVGRLSDEREPAGEHVRVFFAGGLASGTYFCQLRFGGAVQIKKMVLIR